MAGTRRRLWSRQIGSPELGDKDGGGAPVHLGRALVRSRVERGRGEDSEKREEGGRRRSSLSEEGARSRKPAPPPMGGVLTEDGGRPGSGQRRAGGTEGVTAGCQGPPRELAPSGRTEPILRGTGSRRGALLSWAVHQVPISGCSQGTRWGAVGFWGAWAPAHFSRQRTRCFTDQGRVSRKSQHVPLPSSCSP